MGCEEDEGAVITGSVERGGGDISGWGGEDSHTSYLHEYIVYFTVVYIGRPPMLLTQKSGKMWPTMR